MGVGERYKTFRVKTRKYVETRYFASLFFVVVNIKLTYRASVNIIIILTRYKLICR